MLLLNLAFISVRDIEIAQRQRDMLDCEMNNTISLKWIVSYLLLGKYRYGR